LKLIALTKYEFKEIFRNPALWVLVILPVLMSKVVIQFMAGSAPRSAVLPTWLLFAQVMVGVMITGPNILEERSSKTMDALLVTPIGVHGVLGVKGWVVLVLSIVSQGFVLAVNAPVGGHMLGLIPLMLIGAVLSIELGMVIGLALSSPKNGSALASALMVLLFLAGTVSKTLPHWHLLLNLIPSVEVITDMGAVMQTGGYLPLETVGLFAWMVGIGTIIELLVRRHRRENVLTKPKIQMA